MNIVKDILDKVQSCNLSVDDAKKQLDEHYASLHQKFEKYKKVLGIVSNEIVPVIGMKISDYDKNMMMSSFNDVTNDAFTDSENIKKFDDY